MSKIAKISATVMVLTITLALMIVPCFATSNGLSSADVIEFKPFYWTEVRLGPYSFVDNGVRGSSSSYTVFDVDLRERVTVNCSSDGGSSALGVIDQYDLLTDSNAVITSNWFVTNNYEYGNYILPNAEIHLSDTEVLGNVTAKLTAFVYNGDDNGTLYQYESVIPYDSDVMGTTIHLQQFIIDSFGDSRVYGDVIQGCIQVKFDYTNSLTSWECDAITYYGDSQFYDHFQYKVIDESVDVLSWIPNTVDGFLSVEIFPGVNFGTLLIMVIAIPALFAVLKMLGGGG